jgi:hypothetical protein
VGLLRWEGTIVRRIAMSRATRFTFEALAPARRSAVVRVAQIPGHQEYQDLTRADDDEDLDEDVVHDGLPTQITGAV